MIAPGEQPDDLARYQARYTPRERAELAVASLALDIAFLIARARRKHGPRAVVTIALPEGEVGREALATYLHELGHDVTLTLRELEAGRYLEVASAKRSRAFHRGRARRFAATAAD